MSDYEDDDVTADSADRGRPPAAASSDEFGVIDDESVEDIADDVRTDVLLGHVDGDVSNVLEERLEEVGIHLPSDEIDDLAEDIENDVSS